MFKEYEIKKLFEITKFHTAFERKCPKGYSFAGEMHDFWEFVFVIDGKIEVSTDKNVITLSKNQIIFHKPMELHKLRSAHGSKPDLFIVTFSATGEFMKFFSDKIIQLSNKQVEEILSILNFLKKSNRPDSSLPLLTAHLECMKDEPRLMHRFKNLVENFLISLSESDAKAPEVISNTETTIYKNAVDALENRIYSNITVDELARVCNVSTAYLKKIFSKYTGFGIHEYFIKTKITMAKKLLSEGMSVTDVADTLSFSSQNYFSIVFKREEGISPSQFKKQITK